MGAESCSQIERFSRTVGDINVSSHIRNSKTCEYGNSRFDFGFIIPGRGSFYISYRFRMGTDRCVQRVFLPVQARYAVFEVLTEGVVLVGIHYHHLLCFPGFVRHRLFVFDSD